MERTRDVLVPDIEIKKRSVIEIIRYIKGEEQLHHTDICTTMVLTGL